MKFLILLCFLGGALAERSCPEYQHYESCGTACPLTCANYMNPPKACVLSCNPGCHCDEGYVKTEDGKCIFSYQCPLNATGCPVYQHYESCGTACPLTCANYMNPPKACVLSCNPGCHCDEGYVKTEDGKCIFSYQCPLNATVQCGEHEQFNECGTSCPLTCNNHRNPPKICNLMCVSGCQCVKGFVRSSDGRCVRPETCPAKDCVSNPDSGKCLAYMSMWYYNTISKSCSEFIYGGCEGNGNRYRSKEECETHCSGVQRALDRPDCDKSPVTGLCRARILRHYYDQEAGMCKTFIYGGCGGNRNNFATEEECYNRCGALFQPESAICSQDKKVGPCRGYFRRHFFNKQTGRCEQFVYGGCGGNDNNFQSASECEDTCVA